MKGKTAIHLRGEPDRPPEPLHVEEKVAKILLDLHAVTLRPKNPFRYTSGILSPIYTDCRLIISMPRVRKKIVGLYVENIKNARISCDVIAGTSTAGIPWASWIADALNLPMIYVRGSTKEHGKRNQVEGIIKKEQKAIVIEDLISTGESSIEVVKVIRNSGSKVYHVFSIITYGMKKAKKNFKTNNVKLMSLTDFSTVLRVAQKYNYISKNDQQAILVWARDPASWGKKMGFEV